MSTIKIAITLENDTLKHLDQLVKNHLFPNRSQAIQKAVQEKLEQIEHSRLAKECTKLDPAFEQAMAEEGISQELHKWPKY